MTATEYNERVRRAARNQIISFRERNGSSTDTLHKWTVTTDSVDPSVQNAFDYGINPLTGQPYFSANVFQQKKPAGALANRLWQVNVMPGCVNEEPASIEYQAQHDPRGWQMPANYPPYARLQKIFGPNYKFVDRPLWDTGDGDRPVLIVTGPSADGKDLGGFIKVKDVHRPPQFRTEDGWERDLYQASVFVSISPFKGDPTATSLAIGGARSRRWRVLAGQLPGSAPFGNIGLGASGIGACELARLWLLREPGKPENDEIQVQQLVYWNLAARSIIDLPFLELIGVSAMVLDIGLIALSLAGGTLGLSVAVGALGVEEAVVAIVLENLEAILAATSGVAFWTV